MSFNLSLIFFETNYSETETFFQDQNFRNRKRDFSVETKISETENETFLWDQIFRNWNEDPKKIDKIT